MNKKSFRIFILLLLLNVSSLYAQEQLSDSIIEDAEEIEEVAEQPDTAFYFSSAALTSASVDSMKRSGKYSYIQKMDSLLKAQVSKETIQRKEGSSGIIQLLDLSWLKVLLWIAAAAVLLIGLFMFIRRKNLQISRKQRQELHAEEVEEHTPGNFESLFYQAKQKEDFRTAIKFLFLTTLQKLSDNHVISFSPDKTNYQYLQELPKSYRKDFASLSLAFEFARYGNQQLDRTTYEQKEMQFLNFIKTIQAS